MADIHFEYLPLLVIRYKRDEIRSHIEDQIMENMANGMSGKEAECEAIKDMGSAVEAGRMVIYKYHGTVDRGVFASIAVREDFIT